MQKKNTPGDEEDDRREPERVARDEAERVVDRRADVAVGGREERVDPEHALQAVESAFGHGYRRRSLELLFAAERPPRPEETGERDTGAPRDGDDPLPADVGPEQERAQRLGDRGERLVLGERPQAGGHRVRRHDGGAEERQEQQRQRCVARALDRLRREAKSRGEPGQGERQEGQQPGRSEPPDRAGPGPEPDRDRDDDDHRDAHQRLEHAADDVPGQHRRA